MLCLIQTEELRTGTGVSSDCDVCVIRRGAGCSETFQSADICEAVALVSVKLIVCITFNTLTHWASEPDGSSCHAASQVTCQGKELSLQTCRLQLTHRKRHV